MPSQDQTPVKEADLEPMSRNLKKGDRYVVNQDEGLTAVDFRGHVSLAEKEGAGIIGRGEEDTGDTERRGKKLSLDSEGLPLAEER
ncbi:hypothetical protein BHM03_00040701 [Ensete ventricosum]|nr:hypothetical protein BHM03_00040701 [Ensete ventricosum]